MEDGHWTVKTCRGEEWGRIKKLIIDAQSRQIAAAEILLTETDRLVRVPWTSLDVKHEGFFLKTMPQTLPGHSAEAAPEVTVDIPSNIPGRIRERPVRLL